MICKVHLLSQSKPVVHLVVVNAYTKDGMYCVLFPSGEVAKYPLVSIFRVKESE